VTPDLYPILGFALGCVWAAAFVISFNIRTAVRVQAVQIAASRAHKTWPFWSDRQRLSAFVLKPGSLYDSSDTPDVRDQKALLIQHRASMSRRLLFAAMGLILGPTLGVIAAFITSSPR
jgi:hypothetical protein